ncbi:Ig-like domain-containing protein [Bacillus sp. FJAT-27251]|uniref:Ig-like domain-containing protein n=1 Tax=Bacillus sp. FJAT-27251 TaxID=1684142 RepID=UPI0006A7671C|nr:Ig-like domain-containing protein [Bacillus sp. FJAT-27251]
MRKKIASVAAAIVLSVSCLAGQVFAESNQADLRSQIESNRSNDSVKESGRKLNLDELQLPGKFERDSSTRSSLSQSEMDFLVEVEPNDYPELADNFQLGVGMVGDFDYYDVDIFKVKISSAGHLLLLGMPLYEDSWMDLGFGLFDKNMDMIVPDEMDYDGDILYQVIPVQPGEYYIVALDLDNWGINEPYLLYGEMLDITPPNAPTVNPIDDNDTLITGKAEKGSTVTVKNGSTLLGEPKADSTGNFKLTIKPIKAGSKLTFTARDAAGNVSKATTVTVADKTAPSAPKVNPVDDNDKSVSGKTEAGASVTIKRGTTLLGTVKADSTGYYKLTVTPIKAGSKLTVTAKDAAGNVSKDTTVTVADKTPPAAPKINTLDDNDKSISGKTEAGASVTIKRGTTLLGTVKADSTGYYKLTVTPIKAGTVVTVTAKDAAGNVSKASTFTVIDKTPPATLTAKEIYSTSKSVSGKTEAGALVTIKVGKTTLGTGTANSKGEYKITIKPQKKKTTITISAADKYKNTRTITKIVK